MVTQKFVTSRYSVGVIKHGINMTKAEFDFILFCYLKDYCTIGSSPNHDDLDISSLLLC